MGICAAKAGQEVSEPLRTASDSVACSTLRKRLLEMKKVDRAPTLHLDRSRTYQKRMERLSTDCSPDQECLRTVY